MTMLRRQHRSVEEPEFSDPLKNYGTPLPQDDLEQALSAGGVAQIQLQPFATVAPATTVEQAVRKMAQFDVGCVLVVEGDRLAGLFTQHDLLLAVAEEYDQVKARPISDFMTKQPVVVRDTDTPAKAINLMAVGGFRHIPVLDVDDKPIGLLGPRRVTAYLRRYFPTDTASR